MANDFRSARFWASEMIEPAMYPGARAVDATMGNGHDTCWLCGLAGDEGRVYGFDVQKEAVDNTRKRLCQAGYESRAVLFHAGHENMAALIDEKVDVIMFNLGWLPGAEHGVTTRVDTTLKAVEAGLDLLREDGLMTICIYPGHEEGTRELQALMAWAQKIDDRRYDAMVKTYVNQPNHPPLMLAIKKKRMRKGACLK